MSKKNLYNPSLASESTFVYWVIKGFLSGYLTKGDRTKSHVEIYEDKHGYYDKTFNLVDIKEEADHIQKKLTCDKQKEYVRMHYYEGLKNEEIANQLGLRKSTIKGRAQTSLNSMRGVK